MESVTGVLSSPRWECVLLFSFCFSILCLVVVNSPEALFNDESFYVSEAASISEGHAPLLSQAQPPLFVALLSIFPSRVAGRLFSAVLMSSAVVALFVLCHENMGRREAFLACALFFFSRLSLRLGSLVYTEALFVFLALVSAILFFRAFRRSGPHGFAWWGIALGLALNARLSGILLAGAFVAFLLVRQKLARFASGFAIASLAFLPYLVFGGLAFILSKARLVGADNLFHELSFVPQLFPIPLLLLGVAGILFSKRSYGRDLLCFSGLYVVLGAITIPLLTSFFSVRYFFVLLPFLCVLASHSGVRLVSAGRFKTFFGAVLIFLAVVPGVLSIPDAMPFPSQFIMISIPSDCVEVGSFLSEGAAVELPVFDQPEYSLRNYSAFFVSRFPTRFLSISYFDDSGWVYVDGRLISTHLDPWERMVVPLNLSAGNHSVVIKVRNDINLGGIGQVLFCENPPEPKPV
ncbi:MAG: glycosyltransferase family 39 protein [Candidatus Diapherotrites archaeon]|nr:glycosyltransferase family 39 protein [Candidatus Diapherotrites archaeon]